MSGRRFAAVLGFVLVTATPSLATAQEGDGLSGLLLRFFSPSNPLILQPPPAAIQHTAHFLSQPNAQRTQGQLNRVLASQIATVPLASSASSFTFEFDPTLGIFERNTETFGPVFAERALTAGKGRFSLGVSGFEAQYNRFEGKNIQDGELTLYLTHLDIREDGTTTDLWFEGDIIRADLSLNIRNRTSVLLANYGVSDTLDIGVAVPYVDHEVDARIDATLEDLATAADPFFVHTFDETGRKTGSFQEFGTASGIGDVVVRGKWNFKRSDAANLAAAFDVRLPTGDEADLLGSGATQAKLYFIASHDTGRFTPRGSLGYTYSTSGSDAIGEIPNELSYTAGFDLGLHPKASLAVDFVGRTQLDAERIIDVERTFVYLEREDPTLRQVTRTTADLDPERSSRNILYLSTGLKFNPFGRVLVVGNVLFALSESGLQDTVTPYVGIDYTF
jgi:hypothetical protein